MRILHINPYSDNKLYDNLYELQCKKNDIDVVVPMNKKFKGTVQPFGFKKDLAFVFNDYDRLFYYRKQNKILKYIEKKYDLCKYDLIHAHTLFSSGYIAYRLSQQYNIPYIVNVQNTDVNLFFEKMRWLRRIGNEVLNCSKQNVYISAAYKKRVESQFLLDKYKSRIIRNSQVIPYGIDEFWYQNMGTVKKIHSSQPIKLLTVGDISDNKNQKFVLRICNEMIKKGYKIEYNIVGRIKDKKIFNELCREKYVNYLGWNEKESLLNIYRNNDIFILLSKTETFGLVYAEALTQCLPILYTKGEGFDCQIRDGDVGYPVILGDLDGAVSAIKNVLKSYERLSENTIKAVEKFRWNNIEGCYLNVYLRSLRQ